MAGYKKTSKRAGSSTRSLAQRKSDNKGVADGTVRRGRNGRANVYDAKTATWVRGAARQKPASSSGMSSRTTASGTVSAAKSGGGKYGQKRGGSRSMTSPTVSSAVAKGNKQGPYVSPLSVVGGWQNLGSAGRAVGKSAREVIKPTARTANDFGRATFETGVGFLSRIIHGR